jgi:hypothetical protein
MKTLILNSLIVFSSIQCFSQQEITVNNIKPRLDINGDYIDLHDGRITKFGNTFYWYGTAYGNTSGYVRTNYFQCYSSPDLMNWKKEGILLDNKPSGVYYRPHVVYNSKTRKYVLWYNWYPKLWDGKYAVAVSDKPAGPFKIVNTDVKFLHSDLGLGDFSIYIDDDSQAYIAYNTIAGHKGSVEKLSDDYLSSTLQNGGFITENCEAGAIFKHNNSYYLLTDYTCCFCTQGSGARVYVSDNPMNGYKLRNNINRYPGSFSPFLVDDNKSPNQYTILKRLSDSIFSPVQINLPAKQTINQLEIYQFTGNRQGVCGDTLAAKVHDEIKTCGFDVFTEQNDSFIKLPVKSTVEKTSVYNITHIFFDSISVSSILIKPDPTYPYNEIFINEIEMYNGRQKISPAKINASAFILDINPLLAKPVVPAQQTFVMPLETENGIQFIWMGDLWGSASDNIKGHDYQYWSSPLIFKPNGDIEPIRWVDEWKVVIRK